MGAWIEHEAWEQGSSKGLGNKDRARDMGAWIEHESWEQGSSTGLGNKDRTRGMGAWIEYEAWEQGSSTRHGKGKAKLANLNALKPYTWRLVLVTTRVV